MKLKCKKTLGEYSFFIIPYNCDSDNEDVAYGGGATENTRGGENTGDASKLYFDLTVGQEYVVYGIVVYHGEVRYLVQNDHGYPEFLPAGLFEISDSDIPICWEIGEMHLSEESIFVIGYSDLVHEYAHLRGLLQLEPRDVKIFLEFKQRVLEWQF